MKSLQERTVVVTGAASGIGYETALAFADQGARLVISDIAETALEKARETLVAKAADCLALRCDVADPESVDSFAEQVISRVGAPDILVNNAGIAFLGSFEETPADMWQHTFDINVMGIVHCTRAFLPAMRGAGGQRKIVNVASLAGFAPAPNMSAYAASKHAVVGLSEVLAMELHDTDISLLVVCPGIIDTNITHGEGMAAPGMSGTQLAKLQQYYHDEGAHPRVVARDLLTAVQRDQIYAFTGPLAKPTHAVSRFSRRLARKLIIRAAKKSGYLPG
jgi:NAD(P)-dependent dehydrogenase (short-subunit alcohol dehydrogenase family)